MVLIRFARVARPLLAYLSLPLALSPVLRLPPPPQPLVAPPTSRQIAVSSKGAQPERLPSTKGGWGADALKGGWQWRDPDDGAKERPSHGPADGAVDGWLEGARVAARRWLESALGLPKNMLSDSVAPLEARLCNRAVTGL